MLRAFVLGALAFCPLAAASTLVVPLDHPTIQAAIDAAVAGDVIEIGSGVYEESLLASAKADLLITAKGKVLLRAPLEGVALQLDGCTGITVEKLRFEGPGTGLRITGGAGLTVRECWFQYLDLGLELLGTSATLSENTFRDIVEGAIAGNDVVLASAGNKVQRVRYAYDLDDYTLTVTGDLIRDVRQHGFDLSEPKDDVDSVIEDCRIDRCTSCGIFFDGLDIGLAQFTVRRNTIRGAGHAAVGGDDVAKLAIEDCVIRDTGLAGIHVDPLQGAGAQMAIVDNDLRKLRGHGIEVGNYFQAAEDVTVDDNVIVGAGLDGLRTVATVIAGNTVLGCGRYGVQLLTFSTEESFSTLSANVLQGNRLFDLFASNGGFHVIEPDNVIGSMGP